jgi:hypothetical protein
MHGGGTGVGRESRRQRRLLAQEIAQHTVDQAAEVAAGNFSGGRNGLVDDGMHRIRPGFEAIERNQQQGADFVDIKRLFEQAGEVEIAPSVGAQAAIDQVLASTAVSIRAASSRA